MKIKDNPVKFDISEPSTIRGLIWIIGGLVSLAFLWFADSEKALAAITITGSIAGGLGVAVKDRPE